MGGAGLGARERSRFDGAGRARGGRGAPPDPRIPRGGGHTGGNGSPRSGGAQTAPPWSSPCGAAPGAPPDPAICGWAARSGGGARGDLIRGAAGARPDLSASGAGAAVRPDRTGGSDPPTCRGPPRGARSRYGGRPDPASGRTPRPRRDAAAGSGHMPQNVRAAPPCTTCRRRRADHAPCAAPAALRGDRIRPLARARRHAPRNCAMGGSDPHHAGAPATSGCRGAGPDPRADAFAKSGARATFGGPDQVPPCRVVRRVRAPRARRRAPVETPGSGRPAYSWRPRNSGADQVPRTAISRRPAQCDPESRRRVGGVAALSKT